MKAIVNDNCSGTGACVEACPQVFELDSTGRARVKVPVVPKEAEADCRKAEQACPFQAIEIQE